MSARRCVVPTLLLLTSLLAAHGGQYRGPIDMQPPGNPGGIGSAPPSGPGAPGTAGGSSTAGNAPTTGSSGTAASARPTNALPFGTPIGADLTHWVYWWEFNKDSYLGLRDALGRAPHSDAGSAFLGASARARSRDHWQPTTADVRDRIAPALLRALHRSEQRDIVSGAMIALAKTGAGGAEAMSAWRTRLRSKDQEIRETAALALGISTLLAAENDLHALFSDDERGRALTDRAAVDERTRSFAGYALGLLAHAHDDTGLQRRVFETLRQPLLAGAAAGRNLQVAAVQGLRQLRLSEATAAGKRLLWEVVEELWAFYRRDLGPGTEWIQAHAPTAIVDLLGPGRTTLHERMKRRLGDDLRDGSRKNNATTQSAALALGGLVLPREVAADDAPLSQTLIDYQEDGRDEQTRRFALVALGRIGGAANRAFLLGVVEQGNDLAQPWAAMALGLLERQRQMRGPDTHVDGGIGAAMLDVFVKTRNPDVRSALAVGIGLIGYTDAAATMRQSLAKYRHQDEFAGYACIGLALLGDRDSVDQLRDLVRQSVRRPGLLEKAAVALGRLGDWNVAEILREQLTVGEPNVAQMGAVAAALGRIGDRRSIEPLLELLLDEDEQPLARAFAAVALGGMADKELEPWNAKFGRGINYRASVETLTNEAAGILDIF